MGLNNLEEKPGWTLRYVVYLLVYGVDGYTWYLMVVSRYNMGPHHKHEGQ